MGLHVGSCLAQAHATQLPGTLDPAALGTEGNERLGCKQDAASIHRKDRGGLEKISWGRMSWEEQ